MSSKKERSPMSLQKIFDTAGVGMLKQGMRSMSNGRKDCRYRGTRGCKCAVGFLIPDDLYDRGIEGASVWGQRSSTSQKWEEQKKLKEVLEVLGMDTKEHLDLLERLQDVHDGETETNKQKLRSCWHQRLHVVAAEFSLSTHSIDKVMKEMSEG